MLDRNGHVIVLVDEEYGFKHHTWHTGMTSVELERYWASIQSMAQYYNSPATSMPGKWQEFKSELGTQDFFGAWSAKSHYVAHIHWDDDSWLRTPDGRVIHHAGYSSSAAGPNTTKVRR